MNKTMTPNELVTAIASELDKRKAKDIKILGVTNLTVIADYFILATGTSSTQVKALADSVEVKLKEQGILPTRVEGYRSSWVLIDYNSVIVHIFYGETREFYDLERLWKDGEELDNAEFLQIDN